jgi:DNA-binding MarR family transcriptional regulator
MREPAINRLYQSLATLMRRRAELSSEVHPDFSLAGYSMLTQIEAAPGTRATDLAVLFGLDKSTVSRQLNDLETAGLIRREGERPGRRGQVLALSPAGRRRLEVEAGKARRHFDERLSGWNARDIAALADMIDRFVDDLSGSGG